tara:strand:+ start:1216 stop:3228 length:2013 start_codon:yes stop_codon:yes gene_type:complete
MSLDSSFNITLDSNDASFKILGDEKLRITSLGNVGIGTNVPSRQLTISKSSNTVEQLELRTTGFVYDGQYTGIKFTHNTDGGTTLGYIRCNFQNDGNTVMSFATRGGTTEEKMRISPNGNIGIGTTSPVGGLHIRKDQDSFPTGQDHNSKDGTLVLENAADGSAASYGSNIKFASRWKLNDAAKTTVEMGAIAGYNAFDSGFGGGLTFWTHPNDNTPLVERMRITDQGTVNIMNSSKITIQGGQNGGSSRGIYMWTGNDTNWGIYMAPSISYNGLSLGDANACAGWDFNSHAIRFRVYHSSSNGFIFENSSEYSIFSIRGDGHVTRLFSTGTDDGPILRMQNNDGSNTYWDIVANDGVDESMDFDFAGTVKGFISPARDDVQLNTFTGQHICDIKNITYNESEKYIGLIVSANNDEYVSVNNNVIKKGKEAIEIEESVPLVSLTTKQKDKACFGVISRKENDINRSQSSGSWITTVDRELGDNRIYINSLGEGAIWVSNKNGSLESGDYITSSSIPGYGQKQDNEFLANYTVAKITMNCDFQPKLKYKQVIKRKNVEFYTDASNNTYDMNDNLIHWGSQNPRMNYNRKFTIQYYNKVFDASQNVITVTQNILDEHGDIQWEDSTEQEYAYDIRYVDATGNIITKEQHDTMIANSQEAYIAAFVGCTYHCG